jgi:hypothetical protein
MEIAWRYTWACFLTTAFLQRSFPLTEALVAFVLAALVTRISRQKKWHVIQAALFHIAGFIFITSLVTFNVSYGYMPFFSTAWIADLLRLSKELHQWFILLLIISCQLLFWLGGHRLMKSPIRYMTVCIQFDKGLGALFLLFLIILLVQIKGGISVEYPAAGFMVFTFFIFGMIAIGLSRKPSNGQKSFRAGFHGIGIILIFATIVVLGSGVLVSLFLPQLTHLAETTRIILKETTEPMGPVIVQIIRFIFQSRKFDDGSGNAITRVPDAPGIQSSPASGFEGTFELVIGWSLIALLGLGAIIVLWGLGKYLLAWLLKRNTADDEQYQLLAGFLELFLVLATIPLKVWSGLLHLLKGINSAVFVYSGILCWGRRSGLPAVPSETPIEYGLRLSRHFPQLKKEIEVIIETFNMEVYGSIVIDQRRLARILSARRNMRSPRHWPARMKTWLVQQPFQRHAGIS